MKGESKESQQQDVDNEEDSSSSSSPASFSLFTTFDYDQLSNKRQQIQTCVTRVEKEMRRRQDNHIDLVVEESTAAPLHHQHLHHPQSVRLSFIDQQNLNVTIPCHPYELVSDVQRRVFSLIPQHVSNTTKHTAYLH